jgi:dipeptidyl aminopeptidase/acylaminoacyl peptidase
VSTHYLSARYAPDGRRMVSFETRGVRVLDIASGTEVGRPIRAEIPDPTRGVISPDGRLVTPGNFVSSTGPGKGRPGTDMAIRIYELASGKEVAVLKGCTDQVSALAFCPDGRTLAAAGGNFWHARDRTVRVWDIASGRELRRFENHPGGATAIAYLPDGRSLVTIGMDGVALVWDVSDLVDRRRPEPPDPNPAR